MKTLGIAHINLRAPRPLLDQLYVFYTEVVGLSNGKRPPFKRSGYWLYAGEHDVMHLLEASADEQRLTGVSTTIDHIAFHCMGYANFEQRLQRIGQPYSAGLIPLASQRQIVLQDPAGNTVELNFSAE